MVSLLACRYPDTMQYEAYGARDSMCEGTMGNWEALDEGTISIEELGMNLRGSPTGSISTRLKDNRNLRLHLHRVVSGVVQPSGNVVNLAPRRFARAGFLSKFPPQLTCADRREAGRVCADSRDVSCGLHCSRHEKCKKQKRWICEYKRAVIAMTRSSTEHIPT